MCLCVFPPSPLFSLLLLTPHTECTSELTYPRFRTAPNDTLGSAIFHLHHSAELDSTWRSTSILWLTRPAGTISIRTGRPRFMRRRRRHQVPVKCCSCGGDTCARVLKSRPLKSVSRLEPAGRAEPHTSLLENFWMPRRARASWRSTDSSVFRSLPAGSAASQPAGRAASIDRTSGSCRSNRNQSRGTFLAGSRKISAR